MKTKPQLVMFAFLLLLMLPLAAAHAELLSSQPANRAVFENPPTEAVLEFSEPVEVAFSTFGVYRLDAQLPQGEPSEREWQRLAALGEELVGEVVNGSDDSGSRVDTGLVPGERRSERIVMSLEEELEAGVYVIMWRALSIDTHIIEGFVTFIVAPVD